MSLLSSPWWQHQRRRCFTSRLKRRDSSMTGEHVNLVGNEDDGDALEAQQERLNHEQRCWRLVKKVAALVALGLALYVLSELPMKSYMIETSAWIKEHPFLGTFVAIVLFWIAIPLWVPSTLVEAISGSLFGVTHGVIVILIGKTGGSLLTFLIGRRVGSAAIGDYLSTKFPTFRALSEVLNSSSWKPLVLFQLASIPNLVKCYALAITQVSSTRFAISSMIGSMPHAVIWANVGNQASDIAAIMSGQSEMTNSKLVMLASGIVLTLIAMGFLVVYTRRELQELQKRDCSNGSDEDESPEIITVTFDSEPGLARHSDENELIKVRSNTAS